MDRTGIQIEPDMVNAVVEGYFRIPAVWIGEAPANPAKELGKDLCRQIAFQSTLACGIEAYAMRNGVFLFNFLKSRIGEVVRIPGFERPRERSHPIPRAHVAAMEKAEKIGVLRAQIINVHQACLISAETTVKRRTAAMGFPMTAWSTIHLLDVSPSNAYGDDDENVHALARNVLDGKYAPTVIPSRRRVLEVEVVKRSFQTLDHILSLEGGRYVPIVEAAYQSACRLVEHRFGESIAVGWTVCEQMVSQEWKDLITNSNSSRSEETKISRDRREKLQGRDYTASVMVEMLELHGRLSKTLYKALEVARKARNYWAHDMKIPSKGDVNACQHAIRELLSRKRIDLYLQPGFRGSGGPAWPLEMFQRVHGTQVPGFTS